MLLAYLNKLKQSLLSHIKFNERVREFLLNWFIIFSFVIPARIIEWFLLFDEIKYSHDYWKIFALSGKELLIISSVFSLILSISKNKYYKRLIIILVTIYIFLEYSLSIYFTTNFTLLDSVIFQYSIQEIFHIFKNSGSANYLIYLPLGIPILLYFLYKYFKSHKTYKLIIYSVALIFFTGSFIKPSESDDNIVNSILKSKVLFLIRSTNEIIFEGNYDYPDDLIQYWNERPEFEYTRDIKFPLLRKTLPDTIFSNEFNLNKTPPNIVFIMVESLSRSLSGPDPFYCSFTPFIDSLAGKSLYWTNFISNAERTFGVLPNCLGSLPFGENGFIESQKNGVFPKHNTIFNDLKSELNYHTSFYYGGWIGFESLDRWIINQETDKIISSIDFIGRFNKMKANEKGFTWGFSDKVLLEQFIKYQDSLPEPFFNIVQTLTMHEPYLFNDQEQYIRKAKDIIDKHGLSGSKKSSLINNLNPLSSTLFTDEQLRNYFNFAKDKEWFENTIFIIVGDHRIGSSIKLKNPLDRYHVPLIIYSPLLKNPRELHGMCYHMDIAPSLYSLFTENYGLSIPEAKPWLGSHLNFSDSFYEERFVPVMRTNRVIDVAIDGNIFYYQGKLYKIAEELELIPILDKVVKENIENKLYSFRSVNSYVTKNNCITH